MKTIQPPLLNDTVERLKTESQPEEIYLLGSHTRGAPTEDGGVDLMVIHARVFAAIQALGASPRPHGSRKLAGSKREWRIRVRDCRVIYEIADETRIVRVNRVRHRCEVYR